MKILLMIILILFPSISFAANGDNVHLQDAKGNDFGSSINPIYVTGNAVLSTKAWVDCVATANVSDGSICSGSNSTTTGTISASSNSLAVASATGFTVGMGISVANAGTGGNTPLISYITAINGTTFTLHDNAVTTATTQTVNHDDTRGLQDAVNSGLNVHIRAGTYLVSSLITISSACWVMGDGNRGRNVAGSETLTTMGTEILNESATTGVFSVTIGDTKITNLAVEQDTGITSTASFAISIGNGSTRMLNTGLDYVTIYGTFEGLFVGQSLAIGEYDHLWIQTIKYPLYVNQIIPAGDLFFTNDYFSNITSTNIGSYITRSDTSGFTADKFIGGNPSLKIDDSNGPVNAQRFTNCSFEGGGSNGDINISSTTTDLFAINITGGEIGATTGTNSGLIISSSASQVSVTGVLFHSLGQGIEAFSTAGGISITGNEFDNITNSNINYTGTKNISIVGNIYDGSGTGYTNTGSATVGLTITDPPLGSRLSSLRLGTGVVTTDSTGTLTLTAAKMAINGIFEETGTTAATFTLDTGTNLSAAISPIQIGDTISFVVSNASTLPITMAGATGTTLANVMTVPTLTSRTFYAINTGTNTWTIY